MVPSEMNPVLLELWREKHPQGLEQFALDFEKSNENSPYANLLIRLGGTMNPVWSREDRQNDDEAGFTVHLPFPNALN